MAFGQAPGRPATGRQLRQLEELLGNLGYTGFRDARGPLGFTQRQGNGKFTADEADAFIAQLEAEEADGPAAAVSEASVLADAVRKASAVPAALGKDAIERREARQAHLVRDLPAKILARELERRGWILIPPDGETALSPDGETAPPS